MRMDYAAMIDCTCIVLSDLIYIYYSSGCHLLAIALQLKYINARRACA